MESDYSVSSLSEKESRERESLKIETSSKFVEVCIKFLSRLRFLIFSVVFIECKNDKARENLLHQNFRRY